METSDHSKNGLSRKVIQEAKTKDLTNKIERKQYEFQNRTRKILGG
jgi:hypothetical protein